MVQFSGRDPWKVDYDIMEIRAKGQLLDLHNFGTVMAAEYRPPDVLEFQLRT
jgi:hypothetical protein